MPGLPASLATQQVIGRRERKKLQVRRALQRAALELVAERGLAGVTTEQIAAAADVSARTFFNYFASKEAALAGQDPDRDERLRQALVARPAAESPFDALRAVMLTLAAELVERREEWQARLTLVQTEPQLLAASFAGWTLFEQALAAGVAQRTGLDAGRDLYPALLVGTVVSAVRTAALRWGTRDDLGPLPQLVGEALDLLGAGLPTPVHARP